MNNLIKGKINQNSPENFKIMYSFESRKLESYKIMEKYEDRRPIIVEKLNGSNIPQIDKKKYLVPVDLTIGQFIYVIRKRIRLNPNKALYIFVNNVIPPTSMLISDIYDKNKDKDGFLYVVYSSESTFGN